jgi:predicted DNA-binding transcriptional regulator YafY
MTETSGRLLRLLSLLQARRDWPGQELAHRLEVSGRTVRRDIERLRELGYPVDASRGVAGGYQLRSGAAMPPLLLDDDEAVAIAVGLRTAAGGAVDGIEETSVRALAKVIQVMPPALRRRVNALRDFTSPVAGAGPTVDAVVLTLIAQACRDEERLRFGYTRHDSEVARRLVEPRRLVPFGQRWYLLAWDVERGDWRIFRVDRITEAEPTGARSMPRALPSDDPAEYVRGKLYSLAPTYSVDATLHAPAADVIGRLGITADEVEEINADRCRLRGQTDTLEWLAIRLIQLGHDFEVHDPPELAAYLRTVGARLTHAAG